MSSLEYSLLFVLGALVGSYLNVVSLRFSPERGFSSSFRGRSSCPHCGKRLEWYELIPVLSYLIQGGRCRSCRKRLSLQYPIVEILSGLVFILVPWQLGWSALSILWILAFLTFILIGVIDFRLGIIPDRLTLLLALIGGIVAVIGYFAGGINGGSFLGSYSWILIWSDNFWLNRLIGIVFGFLFFGGIYFLTQGKAMGFGDVKLAGALGLLLGWPDIVLAQVLAFIVGSLYAAPLLLSGRKALKDALPFGPFMVAGVTLMFFFGYHILNGYFQLFNL